MPCTRTLYFTLCNIISLGGAIYLEAGNILATNTKKKRKLELRAVNRMKMMFG